MTVEDEIARYLLETQDRYSPGEDEHYARIALEQAAEAHAAGDYGIGAVTVVVDADGVHEFRARNEMFSGLGVVDHAELRSVLAYKTGAPPDATYDRSLNEHTATLAPGIHVFGTLEPCPMCTCALTNAAVVRSVSTVLDGKIVESDGIRRIDGSASIIGEKAEFQPAVWRWIQQQLGLEFALLSTSDEALVHLSERVFADNREAVDQRLARRARSAFGPEAGEAGPPQN